MFSQNSTFFHGAHQTGQNTAAAGSIFTKQEVGKAIREMHIPGRFQPAAQARRQTIHPRQQDADSANQVTLDVSTCSANQTDNKTRGHTV